MIQLAIILSISFALGLGIGFKASPKLFAAIKSKHFVKLAKVLEVEPAWAKSAKKDKDSNNWLASQDSLVAEKVDKPDQAIIAKTAQVYELSALDASGRIFNDMDQLNLKMARIQMEIRLAELELTKLSLKVEQAKLTKELEAIGPLGEQDQLSSRLFITQPLAVISIMAYGSEKSAMIKAGENIQEVKEGETLEAFDGKKRRIVEIDSQQDSVVISESGKNVRYYVAGRS